MFEFGKVTRRDRGVTIDGYVIPVIQSRSLIRPLKTSIYTGRRSDAPLILFYDHHWPFESLEHHYGLCIDDLEYLNTICMTTRPYPAIKSDPRDMDEDEFAEADVSGFSMTDTSDIRIFPNGYIKLPKLTCPILLIPYCVRPTNMKRVSLAAMVAGRDSDKPKRPILGDEMCSPFYDIHLMEIAPIRDNEHDMIAPVALCNHMAHSFCTMISGSTAPKSTPTIFGTSVMDIYEYHRTRRTIHVV
ncbi:MAG: hypothetical protein ACRDDY_05380 [Clostridium sp.]|uniref:hypothetical protein n=1 Tax=Clostridium sp. TaxID=1506 RepID=UPI003EE664FB